MSKQDVNPPPFSGRSPSQESSDEARSTVLLLDDDSRIREALAFLIQDIYNLQICSSASEAVAAVNDDTSVAVLDVKMKGKDGFWACSAIREKYPLLPVIFYSAYQDAKNPYEIINSYQPFAYLIKDGNPDILLATISRAITYHKMVLVNKKVIDRLSTIQSEMARLKMRQTT